MLRTCAKLVSVPSIVPSRGLMPLATRTCMYRLTVRRVPSSIIIKTLALRSEWVLIAEINEADVTFVAWLHVRNKQASAGSCAVFILSSYRLHTAFHELIKWMDLVALLVHSFV